MPPQNYKEWMGLRYSPRVSQAFYDAFEGHLDYFSFFWNIGPENDDFFEK